MLPGCLIATLPTVVDTSTSHTRAAVLHALRQRTGLPLFGIRASTREIWETPSVDGALPLLPLAVAADLEQILEPTVFPEREGMTFYAAPLPDTLIDDCLVVGYQWNKVHTPREVLLAATKAGWTAAQFQRWRETVPHCSAGPLQALLALGIDGLEREGTLRHHLAEIDQMASQLERTYEEISLLHAVTRNLHVSRSLREIGSLCLDRLPGMSDAEGHVIWICTPDGETELLTRGEVLFDRATLIRLMHGFSEFAENRPIVRNYLDQTEARHLWPGLRNFAAAPVREGTHLFGWIMSLNQPDSQEFGTVEASLLNTVATILGTHVSNMDLYRQHEDLLLSFVRSFVSTLDAKDPYTRGHSERVALIGQRLSQELGQSPEELNTTYLSGLLHDVGKIGVDDRILRKESALSDEEFLQIQKHPMIGYNILSGLKNLQHVLPGVRHHHEAYNGGGYPDRLAGDEIPLLARILSVADSYDAMHSDRPYRNGMPLERIETIFRKERGQQWDPAVIDAYFRCREAISAICDAYRLDSGCNVLTS